MMNHFFAFLFAAIVCGCALVSAYEKNPIVQKTPGLLKKLRGLRQKVINKGCDINLCFALDGSGSVTPAQFENQKNFADLIINIITTDKPGNLAAVQYGTSLKSISPLTFKKNTFIQKLHRARQIGGLTNIAGALGYCGFQLRPRVRDANKIIILGDGFNSIGFQPKKVALQIRKERMDICAVAVGPSDVAGLNAITGSRNRVVRIRDFFDLGEIVVGVINDACGY